MKTAGTVCSRSGEHNEKCPSISTNMLRADHSHPPWSLPENRVLRDSEKTTLEKGQEMCYLMSPLQKH